MVLDLPELCRTPFGPSPLRRAGSIRRTSTIDETWPTGQSTPSRIFGRARDLLTPADGSDPRILAQDELLVRHWPYRFIDQIQITPERPFVQQLVGLRTTGQLRRDLKDIVPGERAAGTPLFLLLDDLVGITLIGAGAWSRWFGANPPGANRVDRELAGVCIGFRAGTTALGPYAPSVNVCPVPPLPHPNDPDGWHDLVELPPVSMRRARRLDVWVDEFIELESMFQDSMGEPGGGRVAVHEYGLRATVDPATRTLLSITADPRILPYRECPAAVSNVRRLLGSPLGELREMVLTELRRDAGCTHLNDALRALAEAPVLADQLLNCANGSDARED
jgi:Protein of unknown function (DUF2889)